MVASSAGRLMRRGAFLVGFTIGAIGVGLWGGPPAITAMMTVATVLIVGIAVRVLIRIWFPPDR